MCVLTITLWWAKKKSPLVSGSESYLAKEVVMVMAVMEVVMVMEVMIVMVILMVAKVW